MDIKTMLYVGVSVAVVGGGIAVAVLMGGNKKKDAGSSSTPSTDVPPIDVPLPQ
jgi:hypothetical protein